MIVIRSLENTNFKDIHKAFNLAFSDYPEPFYKTEQELRHLIERRGYRSDISFAAFDQNEIASFTMNGLDEWNSELTAYDTNTGTLPAYRRQGLAGKIFEHSLPVLKAMNVKNYLLEVLKVNKSAIDLYKKQGFEIVCEFDYYICQEPRIKIDFPKPDQKYEIRRIESPDWIEMQTFWDFKPSWQNSIASIQRKFEHFVCLAFYYENKMIAYGFIEKLSGDIPQLAVSKVYRRQGLAKSLLHHLSTYNEGSTLRFINADAYDAGFKKSMVHFGLKAGYGQYEMILKL